MFFITLIISTSLTIISIMSEPYDPTYINYFSWENAYDTIVEGYLKREPMSPPHPPASTPPYSSPVYFPPTPSIAPSTTSPTAPTPSPISPLPFTSPEPSIQSSVSPSAWDGLDIKAFLESIPSASRFDLPGKVIIPPLAKEPSVETEPMIAMIATSPQRISMYKAPRNLKEEVAMLNEVKRLEKKMKNIVNEPDGISHDETWIMELGKVTHVEKESVFNVIGHERVKFGKKRALVFTCLTILGQFSRAWVIKMLATEMEEKKYYKAYHCKKEYYAKLRKQGKRV
jgi:hypothetical protein